MRLQLDTHVVVWLYTDASRSIPERVREALSEASELTISLIVLLELGYLHELGRLPATPHKVLRELARLVGLGVDQTPFATVVDAALRISWTRDPFDRLIVAQSMAAGVPLVTADKTILANHPSAIWKHTTAD